MLNKFIPVVCLTAMLGFGAPSMAQFGDAVKQAGKATVDTTKKAGSAVKEGTEKATTGTKKAVTGAPHGATGKCKDGTFTMSKTRNGACSKHGGLDMWY
ncbi:MAG TPA: DUF3761 domain-containing protein [Vicinamibacterales bacterium]|nr:DUF3761 domain-containing protein [Vicinamibacterales bacterium]